MFARGLLFLCGMFLLSLGISIVTQTGLGTSTISSAAYVLTRCSSPSMGFYVFATNVAFYLLQIAVDRTDIMGKALRQIPTCAVFGAVFDFSMYLTGAVDPQSVPSYVLWVAVGTLCNGLGIACMVFAKLLILPPEGFVLAVIKKTGYTFARIRTTTDVTLVIMTAILSFFALGSIEGIGIGTLVLALCAGKTANVFLDIFAKVFAPATGR